jgi:hypothetical protein
LVGAALIFYAPLPVVGRKRFHNPCKLPGVPLVRTMSPLVVFVTPRDISPL